MRTMSIKGYPLISPIYISEIDLLVYAVSSRLCVRNIHYYSYNIKRSRRESFTDTLHET